MQFKIRSLINYMYIWWLLFFFILNHYSSQFYTLKILTLNEIRAVAEQRTCSLPELRLTNKTKMHLKQKRKLNSKSLEYEDVLYFDLQPNPWHVVMEWKQTLQGFYILKDECFLMTDWCDIDISIIMKNSKSVTLTSRSLRRWGIGMEQR